MWLDELPTVFGLDQAVAAGVTKRQVYQLRDSGELDQLGRGVFAQRGVVDPALAPLAAATVRQPFATLCLTSALVRHDLSDEIPTTHDIALPRGTRPPAGFPHVAWHRFATETFEVGRTPLTVGGVTTAVYSAERTIVDLFRLAHHEADQAGVEALRRWLRQPGHHPSALLTVAGHFPNTLPRLRTTLEILL